MVSQLRTVLNRFAEQSASLSVNQMAHEMQIEPCMLQDMIDYWVRKGKLREVSSGSESCPTCGIKSACPFVVALPRCYELVGEDEAPPVSSCACGCSC